MPNFGGAIGWAPASVRRRDALAMTGLVGVLFVGVRVFSQSRTKLYEFLDQMLPDTGMEVGGVQQEQAGAVGSSVQPPGAGLAGPAVAPQAPPPVSPSAMFVLRVTCCG